MGNKNESQKHRDNDDDDDDDDELASPARAPDKVLSCHLVLVATLGTAVEICNVTSRTEAPGP